MFKQTSLYIQTDSGVVKWAVESDTLICDIISSVSKLAKVLKGGPKGLYALTLDGRDLYMFDTVGKLKLNKRSKLRLNNYVELE